jgi:DNA-binding NarL/FixJ family response regulator
MKPFVVDATLDHSGRVLDKTDPTVWKTPISPATALTMNSLMQDVVNKGTGRPMQLANGIQAAAAIRRELPRQPVVFYSIQDDESYYRDFSESGILTHYAYVRKSNYLLPAMVVPLLKDAVAGRSFVDPEIAARVQEVRRKDENNPLALLEPIEREVIRLLAQGMTNEQIARQLGLRDARAVSRANGQIYAAWVLADSATDEKVARTRATLIYNARQMIAWSQDGAARAQDAQGRWVPFGV